MLSRQRIPAVLVMLSLSLLAGCERDNYAVEVGIETDGPMMERFQVALAVVAKLKESQLENELLYLDRDDSQLLHGSASVRLSASMEQESALRIFKAERVYVSCTVSSSGNAKKLAKLCREKIKDELALYLRMDMS